MNMIVEILFILLIHNAQGFDNDYEKSNFTWASMLSTAKLNTRSIIRSALPTMLKIVSEAEISSECERSLMAYSLALMRWKTWAIQMIDANAKIPSGILEGTLMEFGAFEECLKIRVHETSRNSSRGKELFRGRYCNVGFRPFLLNSWKEYSGSNHSDHEPPEIVKDFITKAKIGLKRSFFWLGMCVPSSCSKDDVQHLVSAISEPLEVKSSVSDCQIDESFVWPYSSIAAICILCLLVTLCIIGTILDVIRRNRLKETKPEEKENENMFLKIFRAFSILENSESFLKIKKGSDVDCFHGIRFLSATWIILGHTYLYTDIWKYAKYSRTIGFFEKFANYLPAAVIERFTFSVSTFFVVSGYLLVKTTWKLLEKNDGKLNVFEFLIHKYWRMTPAVGFTFILLFVLPVIDSGPLWNSSLDPAIQVCERYWWTNFLYINNWFNDDQLCLDHSWFLAALMQLHIVGICLLLAVYRSKLYGILIGISITVTCLAVTSVLVLRWNFTLPTLAKIDEYDMFEDYSVFIYLRTFFHFTSYLVGMITAFIVEKYSNSKIAMKYQVLGWFTAVSLAIFSIYAAYTPTDNKAYAVFYTTIHRTLWALSIGWLIYACVSGFGGIVNRLLSLRFMQPLGNLSYLIYLTHPLVIIYKSASSRERTYFGHTEQVFMFLSTLAVALFLAYIGHVAVEVPFSKLERLVFRKRPKK